MGEKAPAEGSGIFESLFGGFSNGLSIFTNNPFRRKQEAAAADAMAQAEETQMQVPAKRFASDGPAEATAEEVLVGVGKKIKKSAVSDLSSAEHAIQSEMELVQEVEGKGGDGKVNKSKRGDLETTSSEKKRSWRMEVVGENGDEGGNGDEESGSSDRRKRKQDLSGSEIAEKAGNDSGREEVEGGNEKQSKRKKKKKSKEEMDLQPSDTVLRKSERKQKKRQNEDSLDVQESAISESRSGKKERKLEIEVTKEEEEEEEQQQQQEAMHKSKRSQEVEGGEKRKKRMKRSDEINKASDLTDRVFNEATAEVAGTISGKDDKKLSRETRLGTKRKKEADLEMNYEKKMRGEVDEQGYGQGVADMDVADSKAKGKRKVTDEQEDDLEGTLLGKKKRKRTKEERLGNEERLTRTIFVGNLPTTIKTKQLAAEFSQFGAVESARLRSVPLVDSKLPRKAAIITGQLNENRTSLNGYVVFKEEKSAKEALAHNMKEFGGKHLRVDMAAGPRKAGDGGASGIEYDRKRSIFVGNLPFDVEDEELYTLFQGSTAELEVEAVRIVRDPQTSIGKGFAFVCFKTREGAQTALDKANFTMLKNRQLRIQRFGYTQKPGKAPAKNTISYKAGPTPRTGAEERISRKSSSSLAPYEGARAGKQKGVSRTSKGGERIETQIGSKGGKKGFTSNKRPAVAARKATAKLVKGGGVPSPRVKGMEKKRKRDVKVKGKKKDLKGKKRKFK